MTRPLRPAILGALAIAFGAPVLLGVEGLVGPAPGFAVERSPAAQQLEFGVKVALKGSWVEAAFRFERAIALGGSSARAYNNLAVARESLGQFDRAREAYEKALAVKADQDEDRRIRENYERFLGFLKANRGAGAAP